MDRSEVLYGRITMKGMWGGVFSSFLRCVRCVLLLFRREKSSIYIHMQSLAARRMFFVMKKCTCDHLTRSPPPSIIKQTTNIDSLLCIVHALKPSSFREPKNDCTRLAKQDFRTTRPMKTTTRRANDEAGERLGGQTTRRANDLAGER